MDPVNILDFPRKNTYVPFSNPRLQEKNHRNFIYKYKKFNFKDLGTPGENEFEYSNSFSAGFKELIEENDLSFERKTDASELAKIVGQLALNRNTPPLKPQTKLLNVNPPKSPPLNWGRRTGTFSPSVAPVESSAPPTLEGLPKMALPILEFMERVKPHIVIGCDRGGRMFSLAMHAAWRQTRPGEPFPTLDSKIHFTRISISESEAVLQQQVDAIVAASKKHGAHQGNVVAEDERLRLLFVDDWVSSGSTRRLTERLAKEHDAEAYFAVMSGTGADVTGKPNGAVGGVAWSDNASEIGVNYLSPFRELPDGNWGEQLQVHAVRDPRAIRNRRTIQAAARKLATATALAEADVTAHPAVA